MKKIFMLIILTLASVFALVSCGGNNSSVSDLQAKIKDGETMTLKQLAQKAYEESNGKTFQFITNTSRVKDAILGNAKKGITGFDKYVSDTVGKPYSITPVQINPKDGTIYEQINSGLGTYSLAVPQDAFQIKTKLLNQGTVQDFIPKELLSVPGFVKPTEGQPLALQDNIKIFMYNNLGDKKFGNIWDYVLNGNKPYIMPFSKETVGKNFLVMLTKKVYADIMKKAYDVLKDSDKSQIDAVISDLKKNNVLKTVGLSDTDNPNVYYSLAFDKLFCTVANFTNPDDSNIIGVFDNKKNVSSNGIIVYSKIRTIKETSEVSSSYLSAAAYQPGYEGVGGFSYKHYLVIPNKSPYPYTAMAIIAYLTLTKDGYKAWNIDLGDYSPNPTLTLDRQYYGNDPQTQDGKTVSPIKNDKGYNWWFSEDPGKGRIVVEDLDYLGQNLDLAIWITNLVAGK